MFATRTSRLKAALAILFAAGSLLIASEAEARRFRSAEDALAQGIGAFKGGYYEIAIPALEEAAAAGLIEAKFHLARIYADSRSAHTNHGKAYGLFLRITEEHLDVDADDLPEAEFLAKSLVAVAGYWLRGLPDVGVRVNAQRAAEYLNSAASLFHDEDAQFELAKLYLLGEGVPKDIRLGIHWLSTLTQVNHASAQAFLAELYWRGRYVEQDYARALALIETAVRNAPPHERFWIEGVYQTIYCGSPPHVRPQADGLVANFKRQFTARPPSEADRLELGLQASRTCSGSGERVPIPGRPLQLPQLDTPAGGQAAAPAGPPIVQGTMGLVPNR